MTVVPLLGCVIALIVFVSHESGSVSFVKTEITADASSLVVAESLTAVGASLTQVTVIVAVATFEFATQSVVRYVNDKVPQ
jgi:hypothetical protein